MGIQAPQLTPRSVMNPFKKAPLIELLASLLMVGSLFGCAEELPSLNAVSYTHLTLPTIYSV